MWRCASDESHESREYVDYLLDQLAPLGAVRARAMFGGYGIYLDRLMFALVADGAAAPEEDAPKPAPRTEKQRERFQTTVGFVHPRDL